MTPQKYPQNFHTPKIFFFLKTPKNIEIQNFEPQKMSLRMYENIRVSPWVSNMLGKGGSDMN